jgi:AP-1 complex subunit gamma-1
VLYECVRTIFEIESPSTLKTLGINILGKFLQLKDNNSKYLSLFMLKKVLVHDMNAVQKHKQIIMDCLKEKDLSIK